MKTRHDWRKADTRTDANLEAATRSDPDAPPPPEYPARTRQASRLRTLRRALGLTQEQFAARFHIPLGTLRDWEQGVSVPDRTAQAYLQAIAGNASAVQQALEAGPKLFP